MVAKRQQYQAALDKAKAMGGARLIASVWPDEGAGRTFVVRGSVAPTRYLVHERRDGTLRCECPAGMQDAPCYHCAAVKLRQWGEQAALLGRPRRESGATVPPAPHSELLGVRGPLPTEGEGPSAYDLLMAER